jgi:hypothetical protein
VSVARRRCIRGLQKFLFTCFLLLTVPVCLNDNEISLNMFYHILSGHSPVISAQTKSYS